VSDAPTVTARLKEAGFGVEAVPWCAEALTVRGATARVALAVCRRERVEGVLGERQMSDLEFMLGVQSSPCVVSGRILGHQTCGSHSLGQ
jgi:hypothetical protein